MFNLEELIALRSCVECTSTYITWRDEPLLEKLYDKINYEIQKIEDRKPM